MLALTFLLLFAAAPAPEDVRSALERLSAPSAAERREAQRWLAAHLDPEDLEVVAEVAAASDLETRSRLASAVGSDDRHFALAALLASDYEPLLRALGRGALERMMVRWYGEEPMLPVPLSELDRAISQRFQGTIYSLALGRRPMDDEVGTIVRHMGLPEGLPSATAELAVALDPVLYVRSLEGRTGGGPAAARAVGRAEVQGTPDQLLLFAAIRPGRNATVEGFAFHGPRAWLYVVDRDRAGTRVGSDLLLEWIAAVIEDPGEPGGEGAARALAGTSWPAALAWMARRWTDYGDRNSLAGLLLAADRGRVAPELASADAVGRLLRAAEDELAERPPGILFAEEVLRAVGRMGPVGADGSDLAATVAGEWSARPEQAQRLRLGALTGMGRAPAETRAELRALLAGERPTPSPRLRFEALRTLAATALGAGRSEPFTLAHPAPLFDVADELGTDAFDEWLEAAEARPPAAWRNPAALPPEWGADRRARALVWWLRAEPGGETAARHLAALAGLQGDDQLAVGDHLERLVLRGAGPEVERTLTRAGELAGTATDRLALLAGVLPPERELPLLGSLVVDGSAGAADLPLLGLLAASQGEAGEPARLALAAAEKKGGREAPWVLAYERAVTRLQRSSGTDPGALKLEDGLLRELRSDLRQSNHPLARELRRGGWPPPPGLEPVSMEALEIRLEP